MSELKRCPFCGGEAEIRVNHERIGNEGYKTKQVICKSCHLQTEPKICDGYYNKYYTDEEAVEAWNTRKPMDDIVERLEEESRFVLYEMNEPKMYAGIERAIEIVKGEV